MIAHRDTRKGKPARVMGKDPAGGTFYADSPTLLCNPVDPVVAACFADQEQRVKPNFSYIAFSNKPCLPALMRG